MQQYQMQKQFLAAVAILAYSSWLLFPGEEQQTYIYSSPPEEFEQRALRVSTFHSAGNSFDLNSTIIDVYLAGGMSPAYSIFKTDVLPRYSSGRVQFKIHDHSPFDKACSNDNAGGEASMLFPKQERTCLAVGHVRECPRDALQCNYPTCKMMVTNDEHCKARSGYDFRGYYSSSLSHQGYLPLGPRMDTWTSFQKIQSNPEFYMKRASKRKFAFNAVFSQDTNEKRGKLAKEIEGMQDMSDLVVFSKMARKWTSHVNSDKSEQLNTDLTMGVLFDSAFTLSPAGHNPECFRLFEAIEAGSIPVVTKSDLHSKGLACREPLKHWYDSPMLVLESWEDLYPTIEELMKTENSEKLDDMQIKMRMWYDDYMKRVVRQFEDLMLGLTPLEDAVINKGIMASRE